MVRAKDLVAAVRTRVVAPAERVAVRLLEHPASRRTGRIAGVLAVTLAGVTLGVLLAGRVNDDIGPFHAQFSIRPSLTGGTEIAIPPLGSLRLRSHAGPAHLVVRLGALDPKRTKDIIDDPNGVTRAGATATDDVSRGLRRLGLQVGGVAVLGAMLLATIVYRSMRRVALCGGLAVGVVAASGLLAVGTFRASSIEEPRYQGLLTNAPALIGDAHRIAGRYEEFQAELQRLVTNVSRVYGAISTLPVYEPDAGTIRVLHISDLHLNPAAWSVVQTIVQQFDIDLVIDTGDLTEWGTEPGDPYVASIAALRVPYLFVRGNHDSDLTATAVAKQPNATVLDDSIAKIDGLTIAGIGDPRFTPDSEADPDNAGAAADAVRKVVEDAGAHLAETIRRTPSTVDIALVHDPASAGPLAGTCPLVLAGHLHKREVARLEPPSADGQAGRNQPRERTLVMVQGSTGGTGTRGPGSDTPEPLAMSVLYFDAGHKLQAYDDISVGGTGQAQVTLERHLIKPDAKTTPSPSVTPN
jgi:predicted phosphodiesterase